MPTAIAITRYQGMDALELLAPDGARATVLLHGGHLVSWVPAGGEEQLYLSPKSEFASGQAIRGGVPVIFPQFSGRGPLQRHGFARGKPWQLVLAEQGEDDALAVLRLSDDAATRMFWPHAFELELSVRVAGQSLEIELACENKGDTPLSFTAALHSYLRVDELNEASVQGLSGLHYWDSVANVERQQRTDLLLPGTPGTEDLDRIYYQVKQDLTLLEQRGTAERRLQIRQQGFDDAVLWNPGAAKCAQLADMPPEGYRQMLCIEAAAIERPVDVAPGETWAGLQSFTLLQSGQSA
ncbi:D-hexose-6-phosphate mutarotase [Paucibacter sp. APW11]|uniref:Putative glucose-6-phosphate 1-epimerase n=1 Tax=Roseateles aquae TaxID=3077235 RepID=A0ABU3PCN7_9BURK|nr:D-hexose-6-phosphate mutarotase [Paucibacter sp. APW11]MDT9000050.1 D-hexose-6-phosphate mutarotase [Paucibacter sp. APW11]